MRSPLPLSRRRRDIVFLAFFIINILFITYIVDIEQIVIPESVTLDPPNFEYPAWPPKPLVDMVHWWGDNFDPVLLERPVWWRATIWLDALLFGPYYIVAIYAFIKGKEWIRIPTFLYSGILWTNVVIILSEELWGPHATPQSGLVLLANLPWFVFPILLVWRMWKEHPFSVEEE